MKVSGVCSICGGLASPAYTCSSCGAVVCSKCFNADLGLCERCARMSGGRF